MVPLQVHLISNRTGRNEVPESVAPCRKDRVEVEPGGTSRTDGPSAEGCGTAPIHGARVLVAAALGMLDVGDVEEAKRLLREVLR